jgi:chromatin remodeling complex protein RSC6
VTIDDSQTVSSVAPDSVTIENTMTQTLTQFQETILSLTIALNKLKTDFKILEKQVIKEARAMDKVNAKRNKNKGARAPSGFVKPTAISKDLAKFLGVDSDVKMARTDVTKLITAYVKEHKLQAPENGRKILPDKKLMALLGSDPKDEVTYFNLQSYMKSHFIKTDAPLV